MEEQSKKQEGPSKKILNSIDAWLDQYHATDIDWIGNEVVFQQIDEGKGGLVFSAHFGCLEVCRAVQGNHKGLKIVPLMYLKNALKFRNFLHSINPSSSMEVIPIESINAGVAVEIKSRIDRGEFIAILADRLTPNSPERTIDVKFLGEMAPLPEGPFALAWALGCDVFTVFSSYSEANNKYTAVWNKLDFVKSSERKHKLEQVERLATDFMANLEEQVIKNPLQWFNFYDFWAKMGANK